jgi:hypothetical protein
MYLELSKFRALHTTEYHQLNLQPLYTDSSISIANDSIIHMGLTNFIGDTILVTTKKDKLYIDLHLSIIQKGIKLKLVYPHRIYRQIKYKLYYNHYMRFSELSSDSSPVIIIYTSSLIDYSDNESVVYVSILEGEIRQLDLNEVVFHNCRSVSISPDGTGLSHALTFDNPVSGSVRYDPVIGMLRVIVSLPLR